MSRRTRVLWLIKGLGAGGAERLLVSAARVGDRSSFDYEVAYVLPHKTALLGELEANGIRTHCLSDSRQRLPWPLALRRLLATGRYDVVHIHSPMVAGVARVLVRTLRRTRRPVVFSTEHNTWDSYSTPTRLLNASLCRSDQRRWAVSSRVRESMWSACRKGVDVLVHGIVLEDVHGQEVQTLRTDLGAGPDDVVAVTVANFRPEKGYFDLLAAVRLALDAEPRLRVWIVGQGPLEKDIRARHAALGLGERCRFLGYRDDVLRILAAADIFVLASHHEGFPIALMEAMASGLPVVATRVGGVPDAVTDGSAGYLSPARRPVELAANLIRVAQDDELRARMAAQARLRGRQFDVVPAVRAVEAAALEVLRAGMEGDARAERVT